MSAPTDPQPLYESVAIVGVGLIGGSIAAAVKARGLARTVVGIGRSRDRLEAAREAGLLDVVAVDIAASAESELVIVCTPVDRIAADVQDAGARSKCSAVITDAGSVKGAICAELADGLPEAVTFIGSHPLAGSEKTGWENADAALFVDRLCVLTPRPSDDSAAVGAVESFWQVIGMRTKQMPPDEHDRVLALTSHLPHATASALAGLLSAESCEFAATGFRDTTRIAAGDPNIWTGIFLQNAEHLNEHIGRLIDRLSELRGLLDRQNAAQLHAWLSAAKTRRERLEG
ncbi:MAG: prephenate dehydrogenase [Planctomycetaceae bacterium]